MKVYTTKETAELLKVHQGTITRWIRKGDLKAIKLGSSGYRIKKEDLSKFMDSKITLT